MRSPTAEGQEIIRHLMNLQPRILLVLWFFFVLSVLVKLTYVFHLMKHIDPSLSHTPYYIRPQCVVFGHYWTQYNFNIQVFTVFKQCD